MKLFTSKKIKEWELQTCHKQNISEIDLVNLAATEFVKWFLEKSNHQNILIIAGSGNNGSDAISIFSKLKSQRNVNLLLFNYPEVSDIQKTLLSYTTLENIHQLSVENLMHMLPNVLIGMDALFDLKIARSELMAIGATLGADVPFAIMGNVAIGRGHGDQLNSVLSRGNYLWVLAFSNQGLSTPAVYKECDRLRAGMNIANPTINDSLLQALASGDAKLLGKSLVNDLQAAACSLKPSLRLILDVGSEYGALGSIVSGSGPTVAFLVSDQDHALDLTVALSGSGVVSNAISVNAPVSGAKIIESF